MFNTIPEIIEDLKSGRMVIVVDDEDRENEGDLVMAASSVNAEAINFMATHGKGLICVPMEAGRLNELNIHPMSSYNDRFRTGWMVSVDAASGITTGISAADRARTVQVLIGPGSRPEDIVRGGHIFPLKASNGGVLVRAGHTEACVDLMRLSSLYPAGVICEIMNADGTMARFNDLVEFARKHGLKICSIAGLIQYRRRSEKLVKRAAQTKLPTEFGEFDLMLYSTEIDNSYHTALVKSLKANDSDPVLVRVHSECLTGDVFSSLRCDCGRQLKIAMEMIGKAGSGVILYMNQEGRGIGLLGKIKAYALQDGGMDTVEANHALGFGADLRDYGIGAQILVDLGIRNIRLITNNPKKIVGLEGYDLKVVERVPLEIKPNPANYKYLKTKKEKLGHELSLE